MPHKSPQKASHTDNAVIFASVAESSDKAEIPDEEETKNEVFSLPDD